MASPELRLMARKVWAYFGLGLGILAFGIVLMLLGSHGTTTSPLGFVGFAVGLGGMLPIIYASLLANKHDRRIYDGPPGRPVPSGDADPGPVEWWSNAYRTTVGRKERRRRLFLIVAAPAFAIGTAVNELMVHNLLAVGPIQANLVTGIWFLLLIVFSAAVPLAIPNEYRYVPRRVGLSDRGVHAEYDESLWKGGSWPATLPRYAPWTEIIGMRPGAEPGPPHQLRMDRKGGGVWMINGLDAPILARIQAVWDHGPATPLQ